MSPAERSRAGWRVEDTAERLSESSRARDALALEKGLRRREPAQEGVGGGGYELQEFTLDSIGAFKHLI